MSNTPDNNIPDAWHKESAYNCLTPEQFKELQATHQQDDEFVCECDDCGSYTLQKYHRCDCGNRRCHLSYHKHNGESFFAVEVY